MSIIKLGAASSLLKSSVSLQSLVGFAPANFNMLPWGAFQQATDFSQIYFLTGASVTGNVISPSGQFNAQKLVEDSNGGNHRVYTFNQAHCSTSSQIVYRVAVVAKGAERTRIVVFGETFLNETAISASVGFDLAGGNTNYSNVTGTQTSIVGTPSMTPIGNGWWICVFDYQYTGAYLGASDKVIQPKIYIDNGSGTAARSISYTGDGTSGVNLWWFSLMPKAAWGLNNNVFADDFTTINTIDLSDTRVGGFNWYIGNNAPNSINPTWWSAANLPASLPGNFTIDSPSVLKIWNPNNNAPKWSSMMYSVGFPVAGGHVGSSWSPPLIFDSLMSWDIINTFNFGNLGPAFWGHAVEAMAGTIASTAHWPEWDHEDVAGASGGIVDEYVKAGTPNVITYNHGPTTRNLIAGQYHRWSAIWTDIATDGSTGMWMAFFDGQFINNSDIAYTATTNQPTSTNPDAVLFSSFESLHMPIMFNTGSNITGNAGGGYPMYIDWAKVYTP